MKSAASNLTCGGGPEPGRGMQPCGAPAVYRMPFRCVYPQMPVCYYHACTWNGGKEPIVTIYANDHDYRLLEAS